MTTKEKLEIAVQALLDIADPIGKMLRELPEGAKLDGGMAIHISQDHYFLKQEAKSALKKINGV